MNENLILSCSKFKYLILSYSKFKYLLWSSGFCKTCATFRPASTGRNVANLYINLRRSRDCFACPSRPTASRLRLFVCVIALLHLLILGKCYAVHINASSL